MLHLKKSKSFLMTVRWFTFGETSNLNNLVEVAIKKFESHPSILIMTEIFPLPTCFGLNIAKFLKF